MTEQSDTPSLSSQAFWARTYGEGATESEDCKPTNTVMGPVVDWYVVPFSVAVKLQNDLTALRAEAEGLREKLKAMEKENESHRIAWEQSDKALHDVTEKVLPNIRERAETAERERKAALAAMAMKEPVAWLYSEKGGKPWASTIGPESFRPNELSENEVTVEKLYTLPAPSLAEGERIVRDAERWKLFLALWYASTELRLTQTPEGFWKIEQIEAAEETFKPIILDNPDCIDAQKGE